MSKHRDDNPKRIYIGLFGRRYIFEEGRYVGWYHPRLNRVV